MNTRARNAAHLNCRAEQDDTSGSAAFTFIDLVVVVGVLLLCGVVVLPAMARTRTNSAMLRCRNNLNQLSAAWAMYSSENNGRLVSSYPNYGGFTGSWCFGNAASGGDPWSYMYGGADPTGIQRGLLWPYVKALESYKCPSDLRVSSHPSTLGKPILRSYSMNSYMAGTSFGVSPTWVITMPSKAQNPEVPVLVAESEISRPSRTWLILDEDPNSINDCMFLVDMVGTKGFIDLPSRVHQGSYNINFADGHVETIALNEESSLNWRITSSPSTNSDWRTLTNITTAPLQ